MDDYDPGRTVYATDPEDQGEVKTGTGEEYDEPYHDPEWLHMQYHAMGRTQEEMAESCGVNCGTIRRWMNRHEIPIRDNAKAASLSQGGDTRLWDADWLRSQYVSQEKTTREIAEYLDVHRVTVSRALERCGIEARDRSEQAKIQHEHEYGGEKYNDPVWLEHQYKKLGKSPYDIAEENGWGAETVREALQRYGIKTRSHKSAILNAYKRKKCDSKNGGRDLVSAEGIDASWRDIQDRDQSCYLQYRDPTWLRKQVERGYSHSEIAERCNVECTSNTIKNWTDRFGIERDDP